MKEGSALTGAWWNCPDCGYRNEESEYRCEKCGRRLQPTQPRAEPNRAQPVGNQHPSQRSSAISAFPLSTAPSAKRTAATRPSQGHSPKAAGPSALNPPLNENLRDHLSVRVQDFRSRRLNPTLPLQFEGEKGLESKVIPFGATPARATRLPGASATGRRPRRSRSLPERQPALNFPSPPPERENLPIPAVASFRLRMLGHGIDFALNLAAWLVFLVTLRLAAGSLVWDRFLLIGSLCAYLLVAFLYGILFLCVAGATPAMNWLGLRLVNFDGIPAPSRQRLWRLLGAIVSAGSFFLGFLWAAVDEERLSWHDRISKTFLTTANH